ncbi:hypothetical protein [Planctomicrobium piriforme]|uniref:Uncharacterized protein n=1 Tax=Planctomicrobium piriforme TaxID=1576369 RepID=A0A1I3B617_9PLAN|nr:hypothetical protein [Planctomicrobium piriforme]SFH57650.1 hypothetical protein SAMN05421753_101255 [Planctomicrobium piriforme]
MHLKLTEEIESAVMRQGGPLHVFGTDESTTYVIMTAVQFEQIRVLLNEGLLPLETKLGLLRQAGKRAGWDDPEMDAYDHYDENHRS